MVAQDIALKCLCGSTFATPQDRHNHQQTRGHILFCSCTRPFKNGKCLNQHQLDTAHTGQKTYVGLEVKPPPPPRDVCSICNKKCANEDGRKAHEFDKHPSCPTCQEKFASRPQRDGHQAVTGHCYCDEHREIFDSVAAYNKHKGDADHVKSYECVDCDRDFTSQRALDDHLESPGHAVTALAALLRAVETQNAAAAQSLGAIREEESLRCEECKRDFKTAHGFRLHKASVKHKPLSKLKCPLSSACKKHFTSPSALLLHLESGGCKSAMNRLKLNVLIHEHDTARHITRSTNSESSTFSGVLIHTPARSRASSTMGGVVLTPSASASEWSFINHQNSNNAFTPSTSDVPMEDRIARDPKTKAWPCYISGCVKSFKTRKRLEQHLYSPFHAPKLFYCPRGLVMEGKEHEQVFKTISGFAMHLESGHCIGGKEALAKIAGLFEKKIAMVTGKGLKLLLEKEKPAEGVGTVGEAVLILALTKCQ
ncbi:hypothetical protein CERZMDRAFT_48954 [Cercospora zeae-maydis SCOH1-5]|uniref:C2H2-type domain-containing protein n=1 Tax=Cercospora zeae-maydis SCOH1-5 TaxID=717836 RepID=A0A6A6F5N4_9PEZI|nr:hypothetical protein CERZMDRAFT_48954 [Cercospora zeae-maydis SCOH1-5]